MEPDAIEEQRIEPIEFKVNGDKVFVREHVTGRGAGSGIEIDVVTCVVWTLDDHGLVKEVQAFLPHEDAEAREKPPGFRGRRPLSRLAASNPAEQGVQRKPEREPAGRGVPYVRLQEPGFTKWLLLPLREWDGGAGLFGGLPLFARSGSAT